MRNFKGGFCRRDRIVAGLLAGSALAISTAPALAQDAATVGEDPAVDESEVIVVTGIRSALQSALNEERNAGSLIEVIQAEDIGKLPDQNLAEVLENIPGVQITRRAGVGSGVQIRGTNDNRTEINGVSTVGSGSGRGGINFEDVNAAIIASLEVIKAPEARTIEGSVGGTINLRTIRPLEIVGRVASLRVQGEYSEFADSITPRVAASFGDNWQTGIGDIGIVVSGSYTEQDALSLRPRVDRDGGLVENVNADVFRFNNATPPELTLEDQATRRPAAQSFDFLGIQFLNQELENFQYETVNFAGSVEWAPADNLTFFFDAFYNDQQRRQESSRIQGSGVSSVLNFNVPDTFETVNFGSLDGVELGSIQAALTGTVDVVLTADDDDPNLRFSSDTGARLTESQLYRAGFDWELGRVSIRVEGSTSRSDTRNPNLSTTLNFINPNAPLDGGNNPLNDNSVPFRYDLSNGLTFGIDTQSPFAPSIADLLNPANVVLQSITVGNDEIENSEDAFRVDVSYDTSDWLQIVESLDFGVRYNNRNSYFQDVASNLNLTRLSDSPRGTAFADLLVPGPDFAGDFDGRELAFRDFLLIDPDRSFNDPEGTLNALRAALLTVPGMKTIGDAEAVPTGFFNIDETTVAAYAQANFDFGILRGNIGLRYLGTSVDSTGNNINQDTGGVTRETTTGNYDEWLPRVNLVAEPIENVVLRASYTEDINRPDFNSLSTSTVFGTSSQAAIRIGNPGLAPETVASYDASVDWYFAPSALLSVGVFHKVRDNLFVEQLEQAAEDGNGFRDITAPCEAGGIFNPIANRNVSSNIQGTGICVDIITQINDTASTTQTGIEVAFQYDLSDFEDTLGFASGFGVIANYTYQEFGGGEAFNTSANRGTDIFNAINGVYNIVDFVEVTAVQGLLDFSPHAYNVTLFYEKYGLSARARYTWRDAFRTLDTAGGASTNSTLGFPVVTEARGQLNASVVYNVTDYLSFGVEGVNLTKSDITQSCVNEGGLFCFQGLPDRRLTFGATLSF
ncbi:TonB-dependent receptor [Aurantiacibacter marinus]|uniref:TonB-dependent receptor n=1 Tax=Aurantiacibacter marinus TaxID=874156 RepID=A0A0H0XLK1_9SPHN|nr:TonB-dependent receptor [Aurantiacibacter marinus]KLI62866.1 TonB-dependent receptor [Aurantiacibacter marinus]